MGTTDPKKPDPKKRGPEPETLEIEGDWEDAVKKAVKVTPPPPKSGEKKRDRP